MNANLDVSELEEIYELLAEAIDEHSAGTEELFLAKLALLLGDALGDVAAFRRAVALAKAKIQR